jgi:sn-glycerol 3-phosphate transport system permease protein
MVSKKLKRRTRAIATILLFVPAAIQVFPVLYVISLSLKSKTEILSYPPTLMPAHLLGTNFKAAITAAPLGRFLINSLLVASAITFFQVLTAILAAYALARMEFVGKRVFFALIIATMMVPGEVTIIPNYLTVAKLNWIDSYFGLIVPFAASGFGVFLLYQFIRDIPKEMEEAALLDGASRLRFLFQFVVPLSMPAIAAFSVYSFVNAWNQYLWPLIITQSTEMQTVQIGIGMFRSQNESVSWGVIMAATLILISPMLLLFVGTQKQFVKGMTLGGLK